MDTVNTKKSRCSSSRPNRVATALYRRDLCVACIGSDSVNSSGARARGTTVGFVWYNAIRDYSTSPSIDSHTDTHRAFPHKEASSIADWCAALPSITSLTCALAYCSQAYQMTRLPRFGASHNSDDEDRKRMAACQFSLRHFNLSSAPWGRQ